MSEITGITWPLEPHTEAKHAILKSYLGAWFPILATTPRRLLYVDGFAGPGEYQGGEDGSPIVALKVARDHVLGQKLGRSGMELVFLFIEKEKARFENLEQKLARLELPGNFKVEAINDSFENCGTESATGTLLCVHRSVWPHRFPDDSGGTSGQPSEI
jgi:three-Cys-motif partner protein